jgi:hypothetical protein
VRKGRDRDAPADLVRVARAVREGRTTWEAIVSGRANAVPEVVAFQERTKTEPARLVEGAARAPRAVSGNACARSAGRRRG